MGSFKRSKLKSKSKLVEKSRKIIRKESRRQKKINKASYFNKKKESRSERSHTNERVNDDNVVDKINIDSQTKSPKEQKQLKLERKKKNQKKKLLKEANLSEDKVIKRLEKQLKLNKKKKESIPKSFAADGLDYLLDFCLQKDRKCMVETEKHLLEDEFDNDFKTDLSVVLEERTKENVHKNEEESDLENENENTREHCSLNTEDLEIFDTNKPEFEVRQNKKYNNVSNKNDNAWEDIYGRKRDSEGNVIHESTKYIPPAARVNADNAVRDDEKLLSLKRKLKGCLNRVAEHNMHTIANQIEEMYMTNSRNNMNYLFTNLTFEAVVTETLAPNRLVCEHMMLIAILHANIGVEIGAHFLENLVKRFIEMTNAPQDVENKKLDNVTLMISHLYNFKVYGHKLLYQILDRLTTKFTEKEIELILLILKTVGFALRKDDPIALKEFIQSLQQTASHRHEQSSRVRFMLDVLLAIKNNNVSKIPQYDPSHVEHLKKVIKNVIRKGNTISQFNVSLEDLLNAHENGKWWVVGSAWSGSNSTANQKIIKSQKQLRFGKKILELAEKQRMNTDTRRNIFCILMTAEDYLDAFEKLHHLGLKDQEEDEIVHVLIHCCLQENKFNPYYAVLAQKFCEYNRKYQLTIQYAVWDKLKILETHEAKQLSNLARFLTHLLIEKSLALSVLKIVQFTELDKHTMKLLRQIVLGVLLHKNEQTCLEVFEKISISPRLQPFREGLRLFINYFVIKNIDSASMLEEKKIILKRRVEMADKILSLHGSKVKF
ncbi:PREDICTED: nucleolar MIF4G domain-containing protein 1 [Dufourea novaeangliae]|uniref:nucleolar MIF4G domain-containing protein 1 n=1 Tax=Dufourea novaeangliae TaxID=178035 RepID=UPI0007676EAF|nr:PREDICTED: nucleolar MIF4G domain-containing protein 1 [Dufourea novaeangliae]